MTVVTTTTTERVHADALARQPSIAAKVRYACGILGPNASTDEIRTWLAANGCETKNRSWVSTTVNAWRRERDLSTTGELDVLTDEVLARMDSELDGPVVVVASAADPAPEVRPASAPAAPVAPTGRRQLALNAALFVPLLLVNGVAVYGQVAWAEKNLTDSLVVALGFALALESIGVFLAAQAHAALMAGDASGRLRVGSYAVALLVATLNYAHYSGPELAPTPAALAFGGLSAISPWLWAIRSRSMHRDSLRAAGLVDPRAVRFTLLQWVLYPTKTFRAFRRAVWVGETDPGRARALASSSTD